MGIPNMRTLFGSDDFEEAADFLTYRFMSLLPDVGKYNVNQITQYRMNKMTDYLRRYGKNASTVANSVIVENEALRWMLPYLELYLKDKKASNIQFLLFTPAILLGYTEYDITTDLSLAHWDPDLVWPVDNTTDKEKMFTSPFFERICFYIRFTNPDKKLGELLYNNHIIDRDDYIAIQRSVPYLYLRLLPAGNFDILIRTIELLFLYY